MRDAGRLAVVAAIAVVLSVAGLARADCPCVTQESGFAGGDGTPGNPYQVCLPAHLDNVRNHLSSQFWQSADIDMTGVEFEPIGDESSPFTGEYFGNYKRFAISNLRVTKPSSTNVGLFGYIGSDGYVRHLTLTGAEVVGGTKVGVVAGTNEGEVSRVHIDGVVTGTSDRVGGLVGENLGRISGSRSRGAVSGASTVGGLVGKHIGSGARVYSCYSDSTVHSDGGTMVGGLIGLAQDAVVYKTYGAGAVSGGVESMGGLIGLDDGTTTEIVSSFWDINTTGQVTSAGGTGLPTSQMQMQSTFDPPWNFCFTCSWMIDAGNDYPRLRFPRDDNCLHPCTCDDGDGCNGIEACELGRCIPGTPVDCYHLDDDCAVGGCNPETAECEHLITSAGVVCRPAVNNCDIEEVCDGINPTCPDRQCAPPDQPCGTERVSGTCDGNCHCALIPAVSSWGLLALALLVLTTGTVVIGRRHAVTTR